VDTAIATPLRQCRRTPSTTASRHCLSQALPAPRPARGGHARVQGHCVTAQICGHDVNARRVGGAQFAEVWPGLGPVSVTPPAVFPSSSPAKPLMSWVATLCNPNGCNTRPAKHSSTPSRGRPGWPPPPARHADWRDRRRRGIGAAHGAGQHDRDVARIGEFEPQKALLHGVGPCATTTPAAPASVAARMRR